MEIAALVRAHAAFVTWCRHKQAVLDNTIHLPSTHPLRIAVSRTLCGDPMGAFRLQADCVACRAAEAWGDEKVARVTGAPSCVDMFYGASLKALVEAGKPHVASQLHHRRRLSLAGFTQLLDTLAHAETFMNAARALATSPPRITAKLDAAERRFRESWARALAELRGVPIDTHALFVTAAALCRVGLPAEVASIIQAMLVGWPMALADTPPRKRRRLAVPAPTLQTES